MRKVSTQDELPKESGWYLAYWGGGKEVLWFTKASSYWQNEDGVICKNLTHWLDESDDSAPVDVREGGD